MSSKRRMALAFGVSALIVVGFAVALYALGESKPSRFFGDKIGVIVVRGVISDPAPVLRALHDFSRDDSVRAVVLRVDSPGGGVGASQEIFREVQRFKKRKPIVCSMGGVAASGGLYISVPCSKVVASPATITGSIGVISTLPDMRRLFEKIGVRLQVVKSGELKAFGQVDRPLNEAERAMLERLSRDLYDQFVEDVSLARNIPVGKVRTFADGGVFSGRRAKELGLVDELGNFLDAVRLAAELGGIRGEPELVSPDRNLEGFLERFLREEGRALFKGIMEESLAASGPQYLYRPSSPVR